MCDTYLARAVMGMDDFKHRWVLARLAPGNSLAKTAPAQESTLPFPWDALRGSSAIPRGISYGSFQRQEISIYFSSPGFDYCADRLPSLCLISWSVSTPESKTVHAVIKIVTLAVEGGLKIEKESGVEMYILVLILYNQILKTFSHPRNI